MADADLGSAVPAGLLRRFLRLVQRTLPKGSSADPACWIYIGRGHIWAGVRERVTWVTFPALGTMTGAVPTEQLAELVAFLRGCDRVQLSRQRVLSSDGETFELAAAPQDAPKFSPVTDSDTDLVVRCPAQEGLADIVRTLMTESKVVPRDRFLLSLEGSILKLHLRTLPVEAAPGARFRVRTRTDDFMGIIRHVRGDSALRLRWSPGADPTDAASRCIMWSTDTLRLDDGGNHRVRGEHICHVTRLITSSAR